MTTSDKLYGLLAYLKESSEEVGISQPGGNMVLEKSDVQALEDQCQLSGESEIWKCLQELEARGLVETRRAPEAKKKRNATTMGCRITFQGMSLIEEHE